MSHLLTITAFAPAGPTLPVLAGMPSLTLTDVIRMRLETISFFGLGVLLSAAVICWLWNGLRKDFSNLPRLTYRASLFATVLWGLLFVLVLTMISGARELLTPGAWKKSGLTYQLADEASASEETNASPVSSDGVTLQQRRRALGDLRSALLVYASSHEGHFPETSNDVDTLDAVWSHPGFPLAKYEFVAGRTLEGPPQVVAFELGLYGDGRQLALFSNGEIAVLTDEVRDELTKERVEQPKSPAEAGP